MGVYTYVYLQLSIKNHLDDTATITDTWYSVEYDTSTGDLTQHWRRQFLSLKEVHSGILKHILK